MVFVWQKKDNRLGLSGNNGKPLETQRFRCWQEKYKDPPRPSKAWESPGNPWKSIGKTHIFCKSNGNPRFGVARKDNRLGLLKTLTNSLEKQRFGWWQEKYKGT